MITYLAYLFFFKDMKSQHINVLLGVIHRATNMNGSTASTVAVPVSVQVSLSSNDHGICFRCDQSIPGSSFPTWTTVPRQQLPRAALLMVTPLDPLTLEPHSAPGLRWRLLLVWFKKLGWRPAHLCVAELTNLIYIVTIKKLIIFIIILLY
jgi:hypothetical protein